MDLAYQIAKTLYSGKIEGTGNGGWVTCCPVHGDKHPSMSIWDDGKGGVNVDCKTGCNYKDIKDELRNRGLLPSWKHGEDKQYTTPIPAPKPKEPPPENPSFIWKQGSREKEDLDHIKKYLATRAITIDPLPDCLTWNCYHDKKTGEQVNMVVAAASKPGDKSVYAVQRLFIDPQNGTKTRAKMHGDMKGRGVWFGRTGDLSEILVGEGIETILSGMQATGKTGVAFLSTSMLKAPVFPVETRILYFLVDSDPVKGNRKVSMPGQRAAYLLAERFVASGAEYKAFLVTPDDTCFSDKPNKLDFNDLLKTDPTGESIRARVEVAVEFRDHIGWKPPDDPQEENKAKIGGYQTEEEREMFERFVFLVSLNRIVDSWGLDIKDASMLERAFAVSQAGKFHKETGKNGNKKSIPLTTHWLRSDRKRTADTTQYSPGSPLLFKGSDGRTFYNTFRMPPRESATTARSGIERTFTPMGINHGHGFSPTQNIYRGLAGVLPTTAGKKGWYYAGLHITGRAW